MTDLRLYTELSMLPDDLKKEVQDFIEFLKTKEGKQKQIKKREFGAAKGYFKMHDNFDEPLEERKLSALPDNLKSEAANFIDFLATKAGKKQQKVKPKFGSSKDMFIMKPDFDEPLDDFKEYME